MVPSYLPDSIQVLNLKGNQFKEVNLRQLRRFHYLVELNLCWNDIIHLNNDSNAELSTLRVLDISNNWRLQDFNSAFFASIPNLQWLSISANSLEIPIVKGLRNLTYLDMSRNKLINVNSTPFIELEYLEDLNLSSCWLTNLSDTMFTGLSNLQKLNLSLNQLFHLPSGLFVRLTKLKVLDLSHNYLHYLPSGVFVGLTKLKVLDLSDFFLFHNTSFPTDIFRPLIDLEELNVNVHKIMYYDNYTYTYMDNPISKIPTLKRLFITAAPNTNFGPGYTNLKNLEYLEISGNLSEINNETFINLRYTRSFRLSLVSCEVSSISRNTFTSLINLTSLDVSKTKFLCKYPLWDNFTAAICNSRVKYLIATHLCSFDKRLWWNCDDPYLEFLDMSHNNMLYIPVSILGFKFSMCKELNLAHNNIIFFSTYALRKMYNLRKLDLSDQTQISTYSNTHLKKGIKRVTNDSTDQYQLYTVPSAPFYNITTATYTNSNKTTQNIELKDSNTAFKGHGFNSGQALIPAFLERIDVSKSGLICVFYDFDISSNSIKTLIVSRFRPVSSCSISKMLNGVWPWLDRLTKLEYLDLSGNHIKAIPFEAFMHTMCLKHLDLSHNSITTVTFETKYLVNIKYIYLSDNVIQDASSHFMTGISNDLTIYIDSNNLLCDCARSSFAQWLSTTNVVYNITGLMCKYENKSQVSLSHRAAIYQLLKDECIYVIVTVTCVLVFIFLLIGGFCVAILLHKRWKEQYLSVFVRHSVNPYHPLEECQIELEYDIYISYERDHDITAHETMHDFVTKKLYPWLKRRGFKVLIRDELYAGKKLYTEISEALRKTRNVIVLLSNDYCVDFWNVFEFNTAATEGIYTKRQVIIPVTFEILNPVVFHEEITAFLKSGPLPRCTPNTNFTELTDYLIEKLSY